MKSWPGGGRRIFFLPLKRIYFQCGLPSFQYIVSNFSTKYLYTSSIMSFDSFHLGKVEGQREAILAKREDTPTPHN